MRTTALLLFLLFTANSTSVIAQESNDPVQYLNEISMPFDEIKAKTWEYLQAITQEKKARKVEKRRKSLIKEYKDAKSITKKRPDYNGDAAYKNALIDFFEMSLVILQEDFDKILDMEAISERSYDLMEAYMMARELANKKLKDASDKASTAQKEFAALHNITLLEEEADELTKKIERSANALQYYNQLYLIFFKAYIQESYVLAAQNRGDISALEQHLSSFLSATEDGLSKLDTISNYENDESLKKAAVQIMRYYQKEANHDYPAVVRFYLSQDNFEKSRKAFEALPASSRTQENVDIFNNSVNEINKASEMFNRDNQIMNQQRNQQLTIWNNSVSSFFAKFTN